MLADAVKQEPKEGATHSSWLLNEDSVKPSAYIMSPPCSSRSSDDMAIPKPPRTPPHPLRVLQSQFFDKFESKPFAHPFQDRRTTLTGLRPDEENGFASKLSTDTHRQVPVALTRKMPFDIQGLLAEDFKRSYYHDNESDMASKFEALSEKKTHLGK